MQMWRAPISRWSIEPGIRQLEQELLIQIFMLSERASAVSVAKCDIASNMKSKDSSIFESLPKQQRSVLELLAMGQDSSQIGAQLGISKRTVDAHRTALFRRLGISKATEAVAIYFRHRVAFLENENASLRQEILERAAADQAGQAFGPGI